MSGRQRGLTLLGGLILLIPIAIVVYAGIRLIPVYLNYERVARSLDATASSLGAGGGPVSLAEIRSSIDKQFDIQTISFPTVQEVQVRRNGSGWVIEAKYEDTAHLFGNISLLVDFDKISSIGG